MKCEVNDDRGRAGKHRAPRSALINGLEGSAMPVYGRGEKTRNWLFVEDDAWALVLIPRRGRLGEC